MRSFIAPIFVCLVLAGCGKPHAPNSANLRGNDTIATTFYPTTYFAQRIAGDLVEVVCPLPDEEDPIFWKPGAEALASYQSAGLVVLNGAGFEKWVETASLPRSRTVNTCLSFADSHLRYEDAVTHRHGPQGEHSHEGIDGHTWLDPQLAISQCEALVGAMQARWPEHSAAFGANYQSLKADLDALHQRLKALSLPPLLASHPAYNYIARSYGWNIDNLDLDPEAMPSEAQLEDISERLQKRPVKHLLWEGAPTDAIAAKLASDHGLQSVLVSPCETPPDGGDYIAVMNANIDRLERIPSN